MGADPTAGPRAAGAPASRGGPRRGRAGSDRAAGAPAPDREQPADPLAVARRMCLQQLEHAPRTRAELRALLAKRGVPDAAAEQVLERFAEAGLLDDALYARMWVSSRHRGRGLAGRALAGELRRKGVDDELVRAAVDELDPDLELATARALVARRLPATRGLADDARLRRLLGLLARKGYPPGLALRVVREALAEEGLGPEVLPDDLDGPDDPGVEP